MFKNVWLVLFVSFLAACGGGETTVGTGDSSVDISPLNGKDGVDGTSFTSLVAPIVCKDGQNGFKDSTGPDNNPKNGKLDSAEVTSSVSICPPPAPVGWGQRLSYLEPSEDLCGGDPQGGMLFEVWKEENGDGELDGSEVIANHVKWCNGAQGPKGDTGAQGPKGDTGAQGPNGLMPLFHMQEFYDSKGRSCHRWSVGFDTVRKNNELDMGTSEVKVSSTFCEDPYTPTANIGLIFVHTFGVISKNPKHFSFVVTKTNPVNVFPLENPEIFDISYIKITGIFNRPRPDGLVTVHFLKSELQCLIGDQDPRHIGTDTYSVLCPAYGTYIPANENVKAVWQVGPRRNFFELKKIEVFGVISPETN